MITVPPLEFHEEISFQSQEEKYRNVTLVLTRAFNFVSYYGNKKAVSLSNLIVDEEVGIIRLHLKLTVHDLTPG